MCGGSCSGCCVFPHGQISIWAFVFTIIAYAFAINASYGCFFVIVSVPADSPISPADNGTQSLGFGLFSHSNPDQGSYSGFEYACVVWNPAAIDYFFDTPWIAAQSFGYIANVMIGIPMLCGLILSCLTISKVCLNVMTLMLVLGSISELLTFLVFASNICSEYGCQWSVGAGLAVGGFISSAIAAYFFYNIPPAAEADFVGAMTNGGVLPGSTTVEVTETVEPDGTKTTVKTTTHPDGSKTVEETVERPN